MKAAPRSVLLADDDPTMGLLMRASLAGSEFDVTVVTDGDSAIRVMQESRRDLVLLDVEMPGLDGFAAGALMRQLYGESLPIVLVTSHDDAAFHQRKAALRADYIAKPVNWSALVGQLRSLLPPAA